MKSESTQDENAKDERSYWTEKLAGDLPLSTIPHELQGVTGAQVARAAVRLPDALSERLSSMANGSDVRLFAIISAAMSLLLRKYTYCDDVVLNTTIPRQPNDGPFINTLLPLRLSLSRDDSFKSVILRAAQEIRASIQFQNYPVKALDVSRADDGGKLFRVFVLVDRLHDVRFIEHLKPDLVVVVEEGEGRTLSINARYAASRYTESTIDRFLERLTTVLEQLVANVEARIETLALGGDAETPSTATAAAEASITEVFEQIAARFPGRPAVVDATSTLTYRELRERVQALAARLSRGEGVRGRVVALAADRCADLIVGTFAILEAGGAYLPVDLSAPLTRVRSMLEAAGTATLVATAAAARDFFADGRPLAAIAGAHEMIVVGDDAGALPLAENRVRPAPSDRAYLIYTSGSTGHPKGVLVGHGSVVNLATGFGRQTLGTSESPARVGLMAPYTFDGSVKQIFGALLNGHCVYVVPEPARADPKALFDFVDRHGIEILDGTPTHLRQWVAVLGDTQLPPSLRRLVIGGEALPRDLVARILDMSKAELDIVNVYGPTECCDVSTSHVTTRGQLGGTTIPIGRAIPGCDVEVLDADDRASATGLVGEICVLGVSLGQGYITTETREPRALAVPHPRTGAPMYRTGDLGRRLDDGTIEFLRRKDEQLKHLGYRIEPKEIETALRHLPGIRDAVVIDRRDRHGNSRLCAYYVPAGEGDQTKSESAHAVVSRSVNEVDAVKLGFDAQIIGDLARWTGEQPPMLPAWVQGLEGSAAGEAANAALPALGTTVRGFAAAVRQVASAITRRNARESGGSVLALCKRSDTRALTALGVVRSGSVLIDPGHDADAAFVRYVFETERHPIVVADHESSELAAAALADLKPRMVVLNGWRSTPIEEEDASVDRSEHATIRHYSIAHAGGSYIRWQLNQMLPSYMVPSSVTAVRQLPTNANGKLDVSKLPRPAEEPVAAYVPLASETERRIATVWAGVLDADITCIGRFSSFVELGGNSLTATLLLLEMRSSFHVEIPLGELFERPTVAAQAEYIDAHASAPTRLHLPNLVTIVEPRGAGAPTLYLVHDGFGEIDAYRRLAGAMQGSFGIVGIRAIPTDALAPSEEHIEEIARAYIDQLLQAQPEGPYLLGGWSFGGHVAFEMARLLEARGARVAFLGIVDSVGPGTAGPAEAFSIENERAWVKSVFPELEVDAATDITALWSQTLEGLRRMRVGAADVQARMLARLGLLGRSAQLSVHYVSAIARVNRGRSLTAAQARYRADRPVRCDIHYVGAEKSVGRFNARWEPLTFGTFWPCTVPGDHVSMLEAPDVNELARAFGAAIERSLLAGNVGAERHDRGASAAQESGRDR